MPRKAITQARRLRASVPRDVRRLLDFANNESGIAGEDAAIRREFRGWLHRLAAGEQLPSQFVHAPYILDFGAVAHNHRSAFDWFEYRHGVEWLAKEGIALLRECPSCRSFFLLEPRGRRTRKFCNACAR